MSEVLKNILNFSSDFTDVFFGLAKLITSEKERELLNIPTVEYVRTIVDHWNKYGYKLFCIPNLYHDNKELHEELMGIIRDGFFYYKGLQTELSGNTYKAHKYRVFYNVLAWARANYYKGTPKISDVVYDNMKNNMNIQTEINKKSYIPRVPIPDDCDRNVTLDLDTDHINKNLDLWNECGRVMYTLETLQSDNHELHEKYLEVRKISYLYHVNVELPKEYRGPEGFQKYKKEKFEVLIEVVKWAKSRYYAGKPTFPDSQYDYLSQNMFIHNFLNSRSVNVNDKI